jgi:hypothetical protein
MAGLLSVSFLSWACATPALSAASVKAVNDESTGFHDQNSCKWLSKDSPPCSKRAPELAVCKVIRLKVDAGYKIGHDFFPFLCLL